LKVARVEESVKNITTTRTPSPLQLAHRIPKDNTPSRPVKSPRTNDITFSNPEFTPYKIKF
jgi:hypothetical protein